MQLGLCIKKLRKLINVVEVVDFKEGQVTTRDLVLAKMKAATTTCPETGQFADIFRTMIVNLHHESLIIEFTGDDAMSARDSDYSSRLASSN